MKKFILGAFALSMISACDARRNQPLPQDTVVNSDKKEAEVVIYTSDLCSWCTSAKDILNEQKIAYREINVRGNKKLIDEMEAKTGKRTVPQIVINGEHIGSYLSLASESMSGDLDKRLGRDKKEA
ncbi:MAG: glutathione S-transferase N-terminal domain-containing protein [Candidatus Paracaedibacteraceae bacterium]|jgi:glutaredoxin 3|nr:glutathione S-transferase N-terminal domain-containing protein [Candidatus Paracaedibacteraceae bacterium]